MEGDKPIRNAEGRRTTSFMVAYSRNTDRLVGQIAKRRVVEDWRLASLKTTHNAHGESIWTMM